MNLEGYKYVNINIDKYKNNLSKRSDKKNCAQQSKINLQYLKGDFNVKIGAKQEHKHKLEPMDSHSEMNIG